MPKPNLELVSDTTYPATVVLKGVINPSMETQEEPYGTLHYFIPEGWDAGIYVQANNFVRDSV